MIPSGWTGKGLHPKVIIKDLTNTIQYVFEASPIAAIPGSPRQDFNVSDWNIHGGVGTDWGSSQITIDDPTGLLIDDTQIDNPCKIKAQWLMEIWLGQDNSSLYEWFSGPIQDPETDFQGKNTIQHIINAIGYGVVLAERSTVIKFFQAKSADGLTLDNTDATAKVSQLVQRLIHRVDHLGHPDLDSWTMQDWITNCVGYYPFESDIRDYSSKSNHGTVTGTEAYVDGKFGKAFDHSQGGYITLSAGSIPFGTNDRFIDIWIYPLDRASNYGLFGSGAASNNNAFGAYIDTNGHVVFFGWSNDRTSSSVIALNTWTHLIFVLRSNGTIRDLYINGVEDANFPYTSTALNTTSSSFVIGKDSPSGEVVFKGYIDNVHIFAKSPASNETDALYNTPFDTTGIDDIDIKMADYQKNYDTIASCITELANSGTCIWGVDASKKFFFRYRGTKDSGFLVSSWGSDPTDLASTNWNASKFCTIRKSPTGYIDSTLDYGMAFLTGVGANHDVKDYEQTSANASYDLSSAYIAVPFTPTKNNISKISPYLSHLANKSPGQDMYVYIIGADNSGNPNPTDIRQTLVLRAATLQQLPSGGKYAELAFQAVNVTPNNKLFMYIPKYQDSTNTIFLNYQTGTGTYFDSPDGVTWTTRTGNVQFRTYQSQPIVMLLENTTARKSYNKREDQVDLSVFPNEYSSLAGMIGLSDAIGKTMRTYKPMTISVPATPLQLGQTMLIMDKVTGLNISVDLISFDISGDSTKDGIAGVTQMQITFERVFYRV